VQTEFSIEKNLEKNMLLTIKSMKTALKSQEFMAIEKELCKQDILYWINMYVQTYNPRKTPSTIPFITYDYEDDLLLELVERIKQQKDILIDKSRDMGVTWCVLLIYTWFWQFHGEGQDFLVGSRKEQYIDVMGNMDTLLEKVRFIIRNQPSWLIPKGFDWKQHSNYLKIINPESKSTITGINYDFSHFILLKHYHIGAGRGSVRRSEPKHATRGVPKIKDQFMNLGSGSVRQKSFFYKPARDSFLCQHD